MTTLSAAAGAPGTTVTDVVRGTPNQDAVMVATLVVVTDGVVTGKAALAAPPFTTISGGTTTPAVLLASCTFAPSVTPVNVTVPVVGLPPVTVLGFVETALSEGPAGVAALTERTAVRGTLLMAAVMVTKSGAADAFVVIVKEAWSAPAGMVTVDGTAAALGLALKSSATVGSGSGKASSTEPTEDAPPRTASGETDRELMMPVAEAGVATNSTPPRVVRMASGARRLSMASSSGPLLTVLVSRHGA